MKKILALISLALCMLCAGCATTTSIQEWIPDGYDPSGEPRMVLVKEYIFKTTSDAKMNYKPESGEEIEFENEGEPSLFYQIVQSWMIRDPSEIVEVVDD